MDIKQYEIGAIAHYHSQPPFQTEAYVHRAAKTVTPETTVAELFEWAATMDCLTRVELSLKPRQ